MEEKNKTKAPQLYSAYGISRRNPLLWAAVIFAALSVAARIVHYSSPSRDSAGIGSTWFTIIFLVLPCLLSIWYLCELIFREEKRLYKTVKPVGWYAVFLTARLIALLVSGGKRPANGWLAAALIIAYFALAILYRLTVSTGGRKRSISPRRIVCLCAFIAAFALELIFDVLPASGEKFGPVSRLQEIAILLDTLAVIAVLVGLRKHESERPLPQCGDRSDGRRIRTLDPMNGVAVYIMPERVPASNLFRDSFECSNAEAYIREKREEGLVHFGYTHLLLAGYARTVAKLPAVNRFISGQRTYSRDDEIEVSMTIKKDMTIDGSETIITVYLDPNDTAYTVYEKFNKEVEKVKSTQELDSSFDKIANIFNYIPGVLMKFTIWLLKTLDYFGHLPRWLMRLSPFHGSMFVTSMGSLGIPPIFHHLYNFGNIPVFLAFGMKRRENEVDEDGSVSKKRYIDFTVNTDERICDGFYYATAFRYFKRIMNDPHRLDTPPEEVIHDIE